MKTSNSKHFIYLLIYVKYKKYAVYLQITQKLSKFSFQATLDPPYCSDASRARDTRYLASFSTSPQFGIFGTFGRRRSPACLQNGGAPNINELGAMAVSAQV